MKARCWQATSRERRKSCGAIHPARSDRCGAYQGAGGSVRTPFKRHRHRPKLSCRQKAVNKAHARIRCRGERAVATLKTWKILTKLRCSPSRTTAMVQAILVLHHVENPTHQG
jgi:hypothetical protein